MKSFTTLLLFFISTLFIYTQQTNRSPASFDFDEGGISFTSQDSSSSVIMRFRLQNQFIMNSISESDLTINSSRLLVRRARVRFGGKLFDKRISFNFQLSFARADLDLESGFPNLVRDAMVFYNPGNNIQIGFGQTKLPGNRQRVISSGDLQFAERSIVNSKFTIDRDFGIQFGYFNEFGKVPFNIRAAFSQGDGRNQSTMPGNGFSYTARAEILPFGYFKSGGDYFEGDLLYENMPKISIGAGYNFNNKTTRSGGQLGPYLYEPRDINTILLDAIFKFRGFAFYTEYANRTSENPITINEQNDIINIYVGRGYLFQSSYCFRNMYEIATRYAEVIPNQEIWGLNDADMIRHIELTLTKYIHKHRAKIKGELRHNSVTNRASDIENNFWSFTINTEFGI